jgi:hypothetical protein
MQQILPLGKQNALFASILLGLVGLGISLARAQAGSNPEVAQPVPSSPVAPAAGPIEPRVFSHPDRIHYDSQCLTIDGKDTMIFSGAFHYFRCPKELWPERFQKIKDAGLNCVET